MEEYQRKVNLLRENIKARNVTYNWHMIRIRALSKPCSRAVTGALPT